MSKSLRTPEEEKGKCKFGDNIYTLVVFKDRVLNRTTPGKRRGRYEKCRQRVTEPQYLVLIKERNPKKKAMESNQSRRTNRKHSQKTSRRVFPEEESFHLCLYWVSSKCRHNIRARLGDIDPQKTEESLK